MMDAGNDAISNLPEHIIDLILVNLPIKEAVRTSILSRKWRYRWTSISTIVFDCSSFLNYDQESNPEYLDIASAVDQVLLRHVGPVHKFVLESMPLPFYFVNSWIVFLLRNGIKELSFLCPAPMVDEIYKVPSSLFYSQELRVLRLECFDWTVPSASEGLPNLTTMKLLYGSFKAHDGFNGFPSLKELVVEHIDIQLDGSDGLSQLISKCPLLERLDITITEGKAYGPLEIYAPNLLYLKLDVPFANLSIQSCPLLLHVSIDCWADVGSSIGGLEYWQHIENLRMGDWQQIEKIHIGAGFLKALCMYEYELPKNVSTTYYHLKHLSLEIDFTQLATIWAALFICRSLPNLQKLDIRSWDISYEREVESGWFQDLCSLDFCFGHLQFVKMCLTRWIRSKLEFIQYLLANAPLLNDLCVMIESGAENNKQWIMELLQLPRASRQVHVQIFYFGRLCDSFTMN